MPEQEYDKSDGWNDDRGAECCPECGKLYSGNGGYMGPVYELDGTRYKTPFSTNPGEGPYMCKTCWEQMQVRRRAEQNRCLNEFA